MRSIRVFVFDDNEDRRDSLRLLMNTTDGIEWVGEAGDCSETEKHISQSDPDVVLMDIQMPNVDGIEGLTVIRKKFPHIAVIMQTVFEDDEKIFNSIRSGATGYILKKATSDKVIEAIEEAYNGGSPITPSIASRVLSFFSVPNNLRTKEEEYNLTRREIEILGLLVEGLSYKMISAQLNIAYFTVNNHIRKIYEKLQVHSQSEAVSKALREKLVR